MNESQVFADALKLATAEERAAYLDRACAGDPQLRADVEALLQAHASDPGFLEQPAGPLGATVEMPGPPATPRGRPPEPGAAEQAGVVLAGRYKLLEQIGEGGMGTVWMAQQTEPIKRLVAVKLIKAGLGSRAVLARFEAERQALALMDHPNIAKVLDAGAAPDGRPFFVMELVKGVPLTRFCDEHRLTPRQRLELFVPVCQAVQHAHHKGIIHRDLKPSNVLVARYDDRPVPKVIDFGVAKATGQPLTEQTLHTGFGAVVGTVEYMSPEQASFNQLDVDARSDIYSLGVLLYEMLTGGPPFTLKELEQAGMLEMLRVIREQEPSRPSAKLSTADGLPTLAANRGTEPRRLTALLRGELDWIVMKALDKDRNRRYDTASAFAADVERYLHDEPVQACPPTALYRFRKFARRNQSRLTMAGLLVLCLVLLGGGLGWLAGERQARRAERARQAKDSLMAARTLVAGNKLAAAHQKLVEARTQLAEDAAALGSLAADIEALEFDLNRFQQFLGLVDHAWEVETSNSLRITLEGKESNGVVARQRREREWVRQPARAVPLLLQALALYAAPEGEDSTTTLDGSALGKVQVEQIRRTAYEVLLWLAHDIFQRKEDHQSGQKLTAKAAARLALAYLARARTARPATWAFYVESTLCRHALGDKKTAQANRELAKKTSPTMALDYHLLGRAAYNARDKASAVKAFEAALNREPTHYWSLIRLGCCLCDLGQGPEDFAVAVGVFTGCILKRPDHAHAYCCRAVAYRRLKRNAEAVADLSRAIELGPKFALAWYNRGAAFLKLGQPAKALADFSRVIELEPNYAEAWHARGFAFGNLGEPAKAVADYSKAIELDPKLAPAWYNRGAAFSKLGEPAKALADCSKAIDLDPKLALAWYSRGAVYSKLGEPAKAVSDLSKAIDLDPTYAEAWCNRGAAYTHLGESAKAVADYSRAIDLDPKLAMAWYNRGAAFLNLGEPAKAIADCSQAIELEPKYAKAWCTRGAAHAHLRRSGKAVADYSKAIDLDPKFAPAWYNRGVVYSKLGQPAKALTNISRFIELAPNHPQLAQAYLLRAHANNELARFNEARKDCQTALKLAPASASVHHDLAWLLATCPDLKLRDPDRAVELAKRAVALSPNTRSSHNVLGLAHYRAGNSTEAVAALRKSMELSNGGSSSDWLFLAMAQWKLGQKEESRKWYEKAVAWMDQHQPENGELARFRAEAAQLLGVLEKRD